MIDINYQFIEIMTSLGDFEVTDEDIEILKWLRKITMSNDAEEISVANLDGDDTIWFGFTLKRLCCDNKRLKSYFKNDCKDESYFAKLANMNLIKIYPKKIWKNFLEKLMIFLKKKPKVAFRMM